MAQKPGASKHRTSIHNKWRKQRKEERRMALDIGDKDAEICYQHKTKRNKSKKQEFKEYLLLHQVDDSCDRPRTLLDFFGSMYICGCSYCLGWSDSDMDPDDVPPQHDSILELVDHWCYIFDVFHQPALTVLSQLYDNPEIAYQQRYQQDILRALSTGNNELKLKDKRNPNKYAYHEQQCSMWYPIIWNKLQEIELKYSFRSPRIISLITEATQCGDDIAMIVTEYLDYMQPPQSRHRFEWMQDEADSTLSSFLDYIAGDNQMLFKWTKDEAWSDLVHHYKWSFPITEFYVYREWNYRGVYVHSNYFPDKGTFGVFVGRMREQPKCHDIYFYLAVDTNESVQLILSRSFSDLYVNGIESPFVKIECYQKLSFVNQVYCHS